MLYVIYLIKYVEYTNRARERSHYYVDVDDRKEISRRSRKQYLYVV